ncbi:biopolymer transporter ExbD [Verrucomicrobia bacterium]|nr:biopolymer transporter ExbD [Verrucomicrobiota bacterium]
MRGRLHFQSQDEPSEINISPLIDMVFILLIFFIVTTVFVEETGVVVNKPESVTSEMLEKESILIALTSNGQVIYGQREIGVNGVRSVVQRLNQSKDMPVILQSDRAVNAELIVRVIDEARLGGAKAISLSTDGGGS